MQANPRPGRSRPPGRTCGSARPRTATSRRSEPTPRAGGSTSTTRSGGRSATRPSSTVCSRLAAAAPQGAQRRCVERSRGTGMPASGCSRQRTPARSRLLPDRVGDLCRSARYVRPATIRERRHVRRQAAPVFASRQRGPLTASSALRSTASGDRAAELVARDDDDPELLAGMRRTAAGTTCTARMSMSMSMR